MLNIARWKDKVALVTGATTGIGEAIARALAGVGMRVVLVGRRGAELQAVARAIEADGAAAVAFTCDIANEADVVRLFEKTKDHFGTLDVLVNSAGIGFKGSIGDGSSADWRSVLDVNVLGTSICIREALKLTANRQDTAILTVASLAAHRVPNGGYGYYSASKHAIRAIMDALGKELGTAGSPTKVGSISPGTVVTDFHRIFARTETDPTASVDFKRLEPHDVADAVVFMLATPAHVQISDILMRPAGQVN